MAEILLIEPFYGGSHKQLIDLLYSEIPGCVKVVLPAKKWHWRARTSALYLSQQIPHQHNFRVLFASSVLSLGELLALRPDLTPLKKLLYFHENQLVYPVRKNQDRDFQYGYNQILSCLVADVVLFNSQYNQDSFLSSIKTHLNIMPDCRPKGLSEQIRPKCQVLYFPINFPAHWRHSYTTGVGANSAASGHKLSSVDQTGTACGGKLSSVTNDTGTSCFGQLSIADCAETLSDVDMMDDFASETEKCGSCVKSDQNLSNKNGKPSGDHENCDADQQSCLMMRSTGKDGPLHIVWPHRWEHDKNPDLFFQTLFQLKEEGCCFIVSVLGQEYTDVPEIFTEAAERLKEQIHQWGHLAAKEGYYRLLHQADVVVSTADHEFYGVSMLEAVYCGCYPLCPNRLVYPEIFPKECLYNTPQQLKKRLRDFCRRPQLARKHSISLGIHQYSWEGLAEEYKRLLQ
ncbi:glycosyltransferase-like domain-containing protein 1 [Branchiostoma belcheri]|nr:glycosyltransferase-like domain-containing protein 1 [Branchiostoma belcheri]